MQNRRERSERKGCLSLPASRYRSFASLSLCARSSLLIFKSLLVIPHSSSFIKAALHEQWLSSGNSYNQTTSGEGLTKKNKDYKVTEGETFVKESGKDISIRIDHEYTENVKVDDQEVDKVHYKVTKGSTIITFGDMYLNILAVGTYHVKVTFEDGIATTTLLIKEQTKDDNNWKDSTSNNQETVKPTINEETKTTVKAENKEEVKKVKTGDDENIIGVVLLLIGSLVVLTYIKKKRIE